MNDDLATMHLSSDQANVVVGLERAGASLSMIGVILIIITFTLFKRLRTVPNTFIMFASIANIGASTASLIGLSGIALGSGSALCRAQAFLLEMFMQSDPWWSFAMAFNVYLVFFHSANPTTFRRYLWAYCLVCFGLPMIPAIVCLYIYNSAKGPVYGDATLWCWIGDSWNSLRIFSYYIPIWICIFFSAVIYIAVGYHVFHQRNQLRNLTLSNQAKELSSSEVRDSAEKNLTRQPEIYGTVTTEVQITSDVCGTVLANEHTPPMTPLGSPMHCPWSDDPFHPICDSSASAHGNASSSNMARGSTIDEELGNVITAPQAVHSSNGPSTAYYQATSTTIITSPSPPHGFSAAGQSRYGFRHQQQTQTQTQQNQSPATHRLQPQFSNVHHYHRNIHGNGRGSRSPLHRQNGKLSLSGRVRRACHRFTGKLRHMDPVKLAYLRTSFVFAISVLVTWTPSSINRVYALIYPSRISYGLNIASAAVLPLQGVWNAVIYFSTSWNLLHEEVTRRYARSRWLRRMGGSLGGKITRIRGREGSSGSGATTSDSQRRMRAGEDRAGQRGHGAGLGEHSGSSTEMGMVLSPTHSCSQAGTGAGDYSGRSAFGHDALGGSRSHASCGTHGDCYDDIDTESDSLDGHTTVTGGVSQSNDSNSNGGALHGCRRYCPAGSLALIEPGPRSPRNPPRLGTMRVQRGGQLDT